MYIDNKGHDFIEMPIIIGFDNSPPLKWRCKNCNISASKYRSGFWNNYFAELTCNEIILRNIL